MRRWFQETATNSRLLANFANRGCQENSFLEFKALQQWQVLLLMYSSERSNTPAFASEATARQAGHPHPVLSSRTSGERGAVTGRRPAKRVRNATTSGYVAVYLRIV